MQGSRKASIKVDVITDHVIYRLQLIGIKRQSTRVTHSHLTHTLLKVNAFQMY